MAFDTFEKLARQRMAWTVRTIQWAAGRIPHIVYIHTHFWCTYSYAGWEDQWRCTGYSINERIEHAFPRWALWEPMKTMFSCIDSFESINWLSIDKHQILEIWMHRWLMNFWLALKYVDFKVSCLAIAKAVPFRILVEHIDTEINLQVSAFQRGPLITAFFATDWRIHIGIFFLFIYLHAPRPIEVSIAYTF